MADDVGDFGEEWGHGHGESEAEAGQESAEEDYLVEPGVVDEAKEDYVGGKGCRELVS